MYVVKEGCSIFLNGKKRLTQGQEVAGATKEQIKFWKDVGSIVEIGKSEKEKKEEKTETPIPGIGKKEDSNKNKDK